MQRRLMQQAFWNTSAIVLLMTSVAYGQSLGDIARQNREKQNAENASGVQPRVITNASLPKNPTPDQESQDAPPASSATAGSKAADRRSAQQRLAEERAAEQWKRQILAQKNKMATMQARIDQLNASIHSPNGNAQYQGPYTRNQTLQLERAAQIQQQLDELKRKFDQMQDAARRAGMHTPVYDP
jgi:predicted RNase H-like nuclease (RuvC/YqgF family)